MLVIIIILLVVIIGIMLVGPQAVIGLLSSGCGCALAFVLLMAVYIGFVSLFGQDAGIFTLLAIGGGVAVFALIFGTDNSSSAKRNNVPWWQQDQDEKTSQRFHSRAPTKTERRRIRDRLRDGDNDGR